MKKVFINGSSIELPDETNLTGGSSKVYRVKNDKDDLAVKIYHNDIDCDYLDEWHPSEDDLDYFTICYYPGCPILLSKYKITDENKHFIGSATDYVSETSGNSIEQIKFLPVNLLFEYLYEIIDAVPYFTKNGIEVSDWQMGNLLLGKTSYNEKQKLYLVDDTDYFLCKNPNNNVEIDNLIEDIIDTYLVSRDYNIGHIAIRDMKKRTNSISYLEDITKGYDNLDDCFNDYVKVYKRNSD